MYSCAIACLGDSGSFPMPPLSTGPQSAHPRPPPPQTISAGPVMGQVRGSVSPQTPQPSPLQQFPSFPRHPSSNPQMSPR